MDPSVFSLFPSILQVDRSAIPDHAGLHPRSLTGLHADPRILEYQTACRLDPQPTSDQQKRIGMGFVQLHVIGDMKRLHPDLQDTFSQAEAEMAANTGLILNVAVNYGGRLEITQAARKVAEAVRDGQIRPEDISEATLAQYLYTEPENDVDLLIRPGADKRVSNFLLWQMAYAEFWYTQLCWPDFSKDTLVEAILSFQGRERRFGGLK